MTTSLVQLTEEDLGFELLAVLRKIEDPSTDIDAAQLMELAGSEDIEHADLIIEQDYYSLLNEAFFTFPVEKILSCSAEDLDKLFSLVFLVISKIGASKRRAVAPKLMNIITKDHTQHSKTKLNL